MRWPVIAVLVAGCYDPSKQLCVGECLDAPVVPPDLGPSVVCAGVPEGLLPQTCFDPVPEPLMLSENINTNTFACSAPVSGGSDDVCIIAAQALTVTGFVRVRGDRPLVLWSATNLTIELGAVLDVGSHSVGGVTDPGAGANALDCPQDLDGESTVVPANQRRLGAGGCGGPFGGRGGVGGTGKQATALSVLSECTPDPIVLATIRGGCRGGDGGLSNLGVTLNGGGSGGAVYLMARGDIIVAGTIDARGAGGRVATSNDNRMAGGGGGGSGGLIAFDSGGNVILNLAVLNALGGGGSSGAGLTMMGEAIQGNDGTDPTLDPPTGAIASSSTVSDNFGGLSTEMTGGGGGSPIDTETGGGGGGGGGAGQIRGYPKAPIDLGGSMVVPAFFGN